MDCRAGQEFANETIFQFHTATLSANCYSIIIPYKFQSNIEFKVDCLNVKTQTSKIPPTLSELIRLIQLVDYATYY